MLPCPDLRPGVATFFFGRLRPFLTSWFVFGTATDNSDNSVNRPCGFRSACRHQRGGGTPDTGYAPKPGPILGYTPNFVVESIPYIFLMFVLKIPTVGMVWLVLWAAKPAEQDVAAEGGDEDGGSRLKRGRRPFGPRRGGPGPHGGGGAPAECGPRGRRRQAGRRARSRDRLRSRPTVRK